MSEPVNPYAAPEADLVVEGPLDDLIPADRSTRLAAHGVQGMILFVPAIVAAVVGGTISGQGLLSEILFGGVALLWMSYLGLTLYLLHKHGQTIGKWMLGISIVDANTGLTPSVLQILFLRYGVIGLLGQIPLLGTILGLANVLFIFREDRRCIHDHIAGTRVVVKPIRLDL